MLVQAPELAEEFAIPPPTVETINANAFAESIYLKEIVIPPTVKSMTMNPFYGCGARIRSESDEFVVIGEGLYSRSRKRLIHCFSLNETFHVADGTLEIGGCAFFCYMGDFSNTDNAYGEIVLPKSVRKIDSWAFNECCLRRLVINGKIEEIYATAPVDNCIFGEISVPKGLGDYYRKLWYYHSGSIKERNEQ